MATPKCPCCSHTSFELVEIKIATASYRTHAVCCSSCGAVVGVQEFFNIGALIHKLADKLHVRLE
jgi:hypothetical protein